jgi:hypothetical protein
MENPPTLEWGVSRGFFRIRKLSLQQISNLCKEFFLRWTFWKSRYWFLYFCHCFDNEKYTKCYDEKIYRWLKKISPIQRNSWYSFLYSRNFLYSTSNYDFVVSEIDTSSKKREDRHDDISNERSYNFPESTTDDDSHCEVDDITSHSKSLELVDERWHKKKIIKYSKIIIKNHKMQGLGNLSGVVF